MLFVRVVWKPLLLGTSIQVPHLAALLAMTPEAAVADLTALGLVHGQERPYTPDQSNDNRIRIVSFAIGAPE